MAVLSKAHRTIQMCYSMLGRTLWGTFFHRHLILVIAPNRKLSWEKGVRRGVFSVVPQQTFIAFSLYMCQFDLVCFSAVLSCSLPWVSAFIACEVSSAQKLFGDYYISELVSTISIIHSNLPLSYFSRFSLQVICYSNTNNFMIPGPFQSVSFLFLGGWMDTYNDTLIAQYLKPGPRSHGS